jgi:hypothetical protein
MILGSKFVSNITLIERNRIRGWIAIVREGKGFIEQSNTTGNNEPVAFSTNAFTGDNTQIELGDEIEFSLRKISGRLTAENILKVSSTINNFYVSDFVFNLIINTHECFVFHSQFFRQFIEVVLYLLFE